MRIVVSLLTAVCLIAAAEAGATGVALPASKPSATSLDSLGYLVRAGGNRTTTRQWIGRQQLCNIIASNESDFLATSVGGGGNAKVSPSIGMPSGLY
jgi:hypothetical protein